jgi:hypothetical protein
MVIRYIIRYRYIYVYRTDCQCKSVSSYAFSTYASAQAFTATVITALADHITSLCQSMLHCLKMVCMWRCDACQARVVRWTP